jgi:hypothetical protein
MSQNTAGSTSRKDDQQLSDQLSGPNQNSTVETPEYDNQTPSSSENPGQDVPQAAPTQFPAQRSSLFVNFPGMGPRLTVPPGPGTV